MSLLGDKCARCGERRTRREYEGLPTCEVCEDLIEEIVGEIVDETEKVKPEIRKMGKNTFRVLGKADLGEINAKLKTKFSVGEEYETMSGYILRKMGDIPKEGDGLDLKSAEITIKKVEGNRIVEVMVKRK